MAKNPQTAAQMLCDQHVVKMPLESVQMLCAVYRQYVPNFVLADIELYAATHMNHQCTKWVRFNSHNYTWLVRHTAELFAEYTRRFGRVHKSEAMFQRVRQVPYALDSGRDLLPFVQCMPDKYKGPDPVAAYRRYYLAEKLPMARWRHTPPPYWAEEAYQRQLDYRR